MQGQELLLESYRDFVIMLTCICRKADTECVKTGRAIRMMVRALLFILLGYLSGSVLYAKIWGKLLCGTDITKGSIDGNPLDFNQQSDQVKAAQWYIDQLMTRFKKAKYKNLELAGFYWVDEDIATCKDLPKYVSQYIRSKKKEFVWIPYWKAKGYEQWKDLGFDIAYQQPNHFFTKDIPDSRLDEACELALNNGMAMEFECDSKALYDCEDSSYDRMLAYIEAFEKHKVFETSAIAYYTGSKGFIDMYNSTSPEDKKIMDRLARHITARRNMKALTK